MKKRTLIILSPVLLLIIAGVLFRKPILLKIGGFKQPQIETVADIEQYSKEHNIVCNALATPTDSIAFKQLNKNLHIPGVIFFNKASLPVKSSNGTGCPKVAKSFISNIKEHDVTEIDTSNLTMSQLSEYIAQLNILGNNKEELLQQIADNNFDYVVLYTWAKYLPKQSLNMAELGKEAADVTKKILVISVNMDFVTNWYKKDAAPKFEF